MNQKPLDSFGNFSTHARAVLVASQRYAEAMGASLGSEHLLLALAVTPDSTAYQILKKLPVSLDQLRLVVRVEQKRTRHSGKMTAEMKGLLERAAFQAVTLTAESIESEHLLWALTASSKSRAYQLLRQVGIDPKTVRKALERHFIDENPNLARGSQDIEILGFVGQPPPLNEAMLPSGVEIATDESADHEPSALEEFSTDLTELAKNNSLDPLIGRSDELERLIHILGRKTKNNPVLVGEPGVGKTAIVEGLAKNIAAGTVPEYLADSRILSLQVGNLVAGTMYRGQFEERLKAIVAEATEDQNVVLFLDEIHTLVGAGSAEGSLDAANILKPALTKGKLRVIGATTTNEYHKQIEKDAALERRLQPVSVNEPTKEETVEILKGLKHNYETFHNVSIALSIIEETVNLSDRYIQDRNFPDKAIDLLDEAAASIRAKKKKSHPAKKESSKELERKLKMISNQKEYELRQSNLERAAYLRDQELLLKLELKKIREDRVKHEEPKDQLTSNHLLAVISRWTGIPVNQVSANDRRSLLELESNLKLRIVGQDQALVKISSILRRAKTGVRDFGRPIASLLLIGPTGVGKTETAKVIAETVFGQQKSLIKIDMSEYGSRHQVARLIGAPPGYVGHGEPGGLVSKLRAQPHSVVLFDEIEKAHPDVFHLLLQIMEDGVLTDGNGKQASFKNALVVMTSNVGSEIWASRGTIGFNSVDRRDSALDARVAEQFAPEFLGRLDGVIKFYPLGEDSMKEVIRMELDQLVKRLAPTKYEVKFTESVISYLLNKTRGSKSGARRAREIVAEIVATRIADSILRYPNRTQLLIDLGGKGRELTIKNLGNAKPKLNRVQISSPTA